MPIKNTGSLYELNCSIFLLLLKKSEILYCRLHKNFSSKSFNQDFTLLYTHYKRKRDTK